MIPKPLVNAARPSEQGVKFLLGVSAPRTIFANSRSAGFFYPIQIFESDSSDSFLDWWSSFKDKVRWYVEQTHTITARRR